MINKVQESGREYRRMQRHRAFRVSVLQRACFGVKSHCPDPVDFAHVLGAKLAHLPEAGPGIGAELGYPVATRVRPQRRRGKDAQTLLVSEASDLLPCLTAYFDCD